MFAGLSGIELLEALLRMHCGPPLRGQILNPPAYPLMILPATRRLFSSRPAPWTEPGMLVIRSGWIAFLPDHGLDSLLHTLFGALPPDRHMGLSVAVVLRQLCLLPAAEFDRCLEKSVSPSQDEFCATATGPMPRSRPP